MSESAILNNILGVMKPYLDLKANELCINKPCEMFIDFGSHWEKVQDEKLNNKFLNHFLTELATRRNQRFDENHPHLSCELPSPFLRYRVQAQHKSTLFNSEVAICIRIPSKEIYQLEQFVLSQKCLDDGWTYEKIRDLIRHKKNVLLSGGTGSGKTSFLNSLMSEINENERVVTIEDSNELRINVENLLQIAVPKIATENYSYRIAIDNAMRQRPDRLFLGEIDIANTFSFLRINNTGHTGNLSTLHANNPKDAIEAIRTNVVLSGGLSNVDDNMLNRLIKTAIDYIIQIQRVQNKRVVTDILNVKEVNFKELL